MNTQTISIINNKGGVGKTTTTIFLSLLLKSVGKKVLVVDLDAQSNASMILGQDPNDSLDVIYGVIAPPNKNISDLLKGRYTEKERVEETIIHTACGLDLIPSSKRHMTTASALSSNQLVNNNLLLKKALAAVKSDYDYILIDNAPADDILTANSLYASDLILIPATVDGMSANGMTSTLNEVINFGLEFDITIRAKSFFTRVEDNTLIYKTLAGNLKEILGDYYLDCYIRKDIKAAEAVSYQDLDIMQYAKTRFVQDYAALLLSLDILDHTATEEVKRLFL